MQLKLIIMIAPNTASMMCISVAMDTVRVVRKPVRVICRLSWFIRIRAQHAGSTHSKQILLHRRSTLRIATLLLLYLLLMSCGRPADAAAAGYERWPSSAISCIRWHTKSSNMRQRGCVPAVTVCVMLAIVCLMIHTAVTAKADLLHVRPRGIAAAIAPVASAAANIEAGGLHARRNLRQALIQTTGAKVELSGNRMPVGSVSDIALTAAPIISSRTLQFKVCNGFTNQRLSLVYGILLAVKTGRSPVLPCLLSNGMQLTAATISTGASNTTCEAFHSFYDEQFFVHQMHEAGVHVLTQDEAGQAIKAPATEVSTEVLRSRGNSALQALNSTADNMTHVSLDCALWGLQPPELDPAAERLIWHILSALRPAAHLQVGVDSLHVSQHVDTPMCRTQPAFRQPCHVCLQ